MENDKSQNRKDGTLNQVLEKYGECNDISFLHIAIYHLGVYEKYLKLLKEKGQAAFPNRLEYQKFEVARLFIDKIKLLEFSLDPSLKGFKEYKDYTLPPLDAFSMTPDVKEARKTKFLCNIDRGDLLHLKVVEDCNGEFKLLVINKYNENERVADYFIYAYMVKTYLLDKLPRSLQINDFVRAAVLGKVKIEENIFSKLLVTFNDNIVSDKYKDLDLGLVFESEIPFYPKDISDCSSFLNYMKDNKNPDDPQEMIKCMFSLGIDPYKIYSFQESGDGKKLGVPKEPSSAVEVEMMEKSMNLVKEAEKQLLRGVDRKSLLPMLQEALDIYPKNDAAYAVRGQLYKSIFIADKGFDYILKALDDFEKALDLNCFNLIATREYLTLLVFSAEMYKDQGNKAKTDEIMKIIVRCKDICDVTNTMQILAKKEGEKQA